MRADLQCISEMVIGNEIIIWREGINDSLSKFLGESTVVTPEELMFSSGEVRFRNYFKILCNSEKIFSVCYYN
jgi:hypothetical protein